MSAGKHTLRWDAENEAVRDAKGRMVADMFGADWAGSLGPLFAASPALLSALEGYHAWMTADLDEVAAEFYRETLRLAPFKNPPVAAPEVQASQEEWNAWVAKRKAGLLDAARQALSLARGESK